MTLLLDTHALIWALQDEGQLSATAHAEQMPVITRDPIFARYAVRTIW